MKSTIVEKYRAIEDKKNKSPLLLKEPEWQIQTI
jgi:hypothetical protein